MVFHFPPSKIDQRNDSTWFPLEPVDPEGHYIPHHEAAVEKGMGIAIISAPPPPEYLPPSDRWESSVGRRIHSSERSSCTFNFTLRWD